MSKRDPSVIKSLRYIKRQAKGWPVGIPVRTKTAQKLQNLGLVEPAPCSYLHLIQKPVLSVRLTGAGEAHLKIYEDGLRAYT